MPLVSIVLVSLEKQSQLPALLNTIDSSSLQPLVISKPIRWIIRPERKDVDQLLSCDWNLLLIFEQNATNIDAFRSITSSSSKANFTVNRIWSTQAGVPSRLTKDFVTKSNPALLHSAASQIPQLTGALSKPIVQDSSQDLSLSHDLKSWIGNSAQALPLEGAVSMLNLLSFKPDMKSSYLKYGAAFAETIGSKRGGNAKLVGNIVREENTKAPANELVWHEFALAHYPSLLHFADMLASEDYQAVNQKFRVPALADTCILCTSEIEIEKMMRETEVNKAKL